MGARAFTRVDVATSATIAFGATVLQGTTENLSLQGMYLRVPRSVPLHQPIKVVLSQYQATPVQLSGRVVRQDDGGGMGVKINSIDVNSFVNLRNIITRQCNDFNRIMSETYRMVDCIR